MSNPQTLRTLTDSPEGAPGATTTLVRADPRSPPEAHPDLHPSLRAQLREMQLRTGNATPDLAMLLRLIDDHYETLEKERRGTVEAMRLMADEARALAREAHAQSSEHLQVILDHIKDAVLRDHRDRGGDESVQRALSHGRAQAARLQVRAR